MKFLLSWKLLFCGADIFPGGGRLSKASADDGILVK